jgi:hypothetical protein
VLEYLSNLPQFWMAVTALCGVITVAIREYAKYQRFKLALKKAKGSERRKILEAMARMEARWSWRRDPKAKPPGPSLPARGHDSSSA